VRYANHRPVISVRERFDAKWIPEPNTGCWLWLGAALKNGYGRLSVGQRSQGERRTLYAHRLAYELFVGPIPPDRELDHLCRNRICCNPEHLEPVTRRVNILRGIGPNKLGAINAMKTHCTHGHEFTIENTRHRPAGGRSCRACARELARRDHAHAH
jgi:hypothetical protein